MEKYIPTTDLPLTLKNELEQIDSKYNASREYLQNFQYVIKEYFTKSDNRGLLVFFGTGTGKTILAASISEYYRINEPSRKIVILLSKSLQSNFETNIKKFIKNTTKETDLSGVIEKKYKFVSLNASNMYSQMTRITKTSEEIEFEKKIGKLNEHITDKEFLENSLIIVDEAHNLATGISNGAKNSIMLYNTIMKTKNIKLIFLTATPIVNNPFELVPIFNLLRGYALFPENQTDFYSFFVENKKGKLHLKNKDKFQNRIIGMVSYYGDFYHKKSKDGFPKEFPLKIENIPMSIEQFTKYQKMRDIEIDEDSRRFKKSSHSEFFQVNSDDTTQSSYRIRSRQVSNYFIPDYAIESNNKIEKNLDKIRPVDLKNLNRFSPKINRILHNISKYPNQLGLVYSEFVSAEGLEIFRRILDINDYVYWEKKWMYDDGLIKVGSQKKTYALITGNVAFADRKFIIDAFNSKENKNGEIITLLLISKSGAEGISLHNVRHIHIMEPFWNYARIEQIIARGVRFQSHKDLPIEDRTVQPYIYISGYPKDYNKKMIKERTTDEEIMYASITGKRLRTEFETAIIESSIDCSLHYKNLEQNIKDKFKCKLCAPTAEPLYGLNLYEDINAYNTCKPVEETVVPTKKVELNINGKKQIFRYSDINKKIQIYEFDDNIGSYTHMNKGNPLYADIMRKILHI